MNNAGISNDVFVGRMALISPEIEFLSDYIKASYKVKCRCKIDGYEWESTANNLLKGRKCPKCTGHIGIHKDEINQILIKNGLNIESIHDGFTSQYKSSSFRCKHCGYTWNEKLSNIMRRMYECPNCEEIRLKSQKSIGSKIKKHIMSESEYVNYVRENNPTVVLEGKYHSSNPTLHKCLICGNEWMARVHGIKKGGGCPECTRISLTLTEEELCKRAKTFTPFLNIIGEYKKSKDRIRCCCNVCGYKWDSYIDYFTKPHKGCPVCTNIVLCDGINSLYDTRQDIALMLKDISVSHKYMSGSGHKALFICQNCGEEKISSINQVCKKGLSCNRCGDGISYPNKYTYSFLKQLNVEFLTEIEFPWSFKRRYDFYLPNENAIIEVHGMQHYKQTFLQGRTLEEEQSNDLLKKQLALSNGISKYIVIDARVSSSEYISRSLECSFLSSMENFCNVDFSKCNADAIKSNVVKCCDLYNSGMSRKKIKDALCVCLETVDRYIKKGIDVGLIQSV